VKSLDTLGVDFLITIGGDDTASSAMRVAEAAEGRLRVVHVPKTVDNDLPLPIGIPTFGFETAREHATAVVERILEDMRTTRRWFFIIMMGRTAGHLALGAGKSAGAPIALIPEDFSETPIQMEDVVRTLEGAIVRRLAEGRPDGVAVIAEGIAEHLDESDPILQGAPRDEHGHIRLAEIPLGDVLRKAVRESLASRGVTVAIGEKDVGYEVRCGYPTAFDRDYTRDLGVGAVHEIVDPATGRARVRHVDTASDSYRNALALQERITAEDLADDAMLARIAKAANLSPDEAKQRYSPL